jgi:hypothetical protein
MALEVEQPIAGSSPRIRSVGGPQDRRELLSAHEEPSRTLMVSGVGPHTSEADIRALFQVRSALRFCWASRMPCGSQSRLGGRLWWGLASITVSRHTAAAAVAMEGRGNVSTGNGWRPVACPGLIVLTVNSNGFSTASRTSSDGGIFYGETLCYLSTPLDSVVATT